MRKSTIRKGLTQKQMAEKFNICIDTVKKYTSEPREQYENTARIRRKKAYVLREMGFKWKDIGEKLDTTINGAVALYKRYVALDLPNQQEDQELAKIVEERKNEKSHPVNLDDFINSGKVGFLKDQDKKLNTELDKKLDKDIEDLFNK